MKPIPMNYCYTFNLKPNTIIVTHFSGEQFKPRGNHIRRRDKESFQLAVSSIANTDGKEVKNSKATKLDCSDSR